MYNEVMRIYNILYTINARLGFLIKFTTLKVSYLELILYIYNNVFKKKKWVKIKNLQKK